MQLASHSLACTTRVALPLPSPPTTSSAGARERRCVIERVCSLSATTWSIQEVAHLVPVEEKGTDPDFVAVRCGGGINLSGGIVETSPTCPDCIMGRVTL